MSDAYADNIHLAKKSMKLRQVCGEEGMDSSHIGSGGEPDSV